MCSFGKDSIVLCDILESYGVRDVMYLENIDELVDEKYNADVMARYQLRVHPLPRGRGMLFFIRGTAQYFCFPFLSPTTMLPVPMALSPWQNEGPYLCIDEELRATHGTVVPYDFDGLLFGHKRCDLLDGGGACLPWFPFLSAENRQAYHARMTPQAPEWPLNEMEACSPLYDWSQADVWAYIEAHHLPVSAKVYDGHARRLHHNRACYRCHDPSLPARVECPKLGQSITNLGPFTACGAEALVPLGLMTTAEAACLQEEAHAI